MAMHKKGDKYRQLLARSDEYTVILADLHPLPETIGYWQLELLVASTYWNDKHPIACKRIVDKITYIVQHVPPTLSDKASRQLFINNFKPPLRFIQNVAIADLNNLPPFKLRLDCGVSMYHTCDISSELVEWLESTGRVDVIECPICLETLHINQPIKCIPNCDHYICTPCLISWSKSGRSRIACPTCAKPVDSIWLGHIQTETALAEKFN